MLCQSTQPNNSHSNNQINSIINKERNKCKFTILLLGSSDSGKSTITKQLNILQQQKESDYYEGTQTGIYKKSIHREIVRGIKSLLDYMDSLETTNTKIGAVNELKSIGFEYSTKLDNENIGNLVYNIWQNDEIREIMVKANKLNLISDSLPYYLNNIHRISKIDYEPTQKDIILLYFRTIGIHETNIELEKIYYNFIELSSLVINSQKKKWVPYFDNVTAILYCVSLNDFDKELIYDNNSNSMLNSLKTFKEICNITFPDIPIILFFTKPDLLKDKIQKSTGYLSKTFQDYQDCSDYEKAIDFIKIQFLKSNLIPNKSIYNTVSNLTEPINFNFILRSIRDINISSNYKNNNNNNN